MLYFSVKINLLYNNHTECFLSIYKEKMASPASLACPIMILCSYNISTFKRKPKMQYSYFPNKEAPRNIIK